MTIPAKADLGTLRLSLLRRLGFTAAIATASINRDLLDSFIQGAQEQLYWEYDFRELKKVTDLSVSSRFVDWPNECEPRKIFSIQTDVGGGIWNHLKFGIDYKFDSYPKGGVWPQRWDYGDDYGTDKLEIWPIPSSTYTVRLEYYKRLGPFLADSDKATLDTKPIFLMALFNAKSHYRQPDANIYSTQLNAYIRRLKAANHQGRRYLRGDDAPEPTPMPRLV